MSDSNEDLFTIERHGDVTIVFPSPQLEDLDFEATNEIADLVLGPVRSLPDPVVLVDLAEVAYFGSSFLSVLLRCWRMVLEKNGQMALSGVSSRARELLRLTSLDILWPIYETRSEALMALQAD